MRRIGWRVALVSAVIALVVPVGAKAATPPLGGGVAQVSDTSNIYGFVSVGDATLTGLFTLNGSTQVGTVTIAGWPCGDGKGGTCGYYPSTPLSGTTVTGGIIAGSCSGLYASLIVGATLIFRCHASLNHGPTAGLTLRVVYETVFGFGQGSCAPFPLGCFNSPVLIPYVGVYVQTPS
jgi:hypothetical protein